MRFLVIFAIVFSLVSPRLVFAAEGDVLFSGDPYYIYVIRKTSSGVSKRVDENSTLLPQIVYLLTLPQYSNAVDDNKTAVQQYWLHDYGVYINSLSVDGKSYRMHVRGHNFRLVPWLNTRFNLNMYGDVIIPDSSLNKKFTPQNLFAWQVQSPVSPVGATASIVYDLVDDNGNYIGFSEPVDVEASITFVGTIYSTLAIMQEQIEDFEVYLADIAYDTAQLSSKLDKVSSLVSSGFASIDSRLLQILDAINNLAISGGGTSAVVGQLVDIKAELDEIDRNQINGTSALTNALQSGVAAINKNATENQQRTEQLLHLVDDSINNVTDFLNDKISEDQRAAQESGDKISGLATKLQSQVSDKWGFLTYPVKFYQTIFSAFTGSRTAAYRSVYDGVVGYRYDDDSGGLVPIYDLGRATEPSYINGTTITFPSFSISVPGEGTYQVWGESDYNIASLKTQFPALFDAIYVASGILMCAWIVSHLLHVFNYVLGNSVEEEE